jgi:2-iminobutanoate/2-iminopropanoate deaminase
MCKRGVPSPTTLADVVSLRIYLVGEHIHKGAPVSAALREFFPADNLPTSTWIGVTALANPYFLIEVEAVAVIEEVVPDVNT